MFLVQLIQSCHVSTGLQKRVKDLKFDSICGMTTLFIKQWYCGA